MKLHSDTLTEQDIRDAAKVAGVSIWEMRKMKNTRKRANGWEIFLWGSSSYRSQATGESAATWDEHGVFMAELYAKDSHMAIAYYTDREHFMRETRSIVESAWNRTRPVSQRKVGAWL